jgi:hypothetical protein
MRVSSASRHQCCAIIAVPETGDGPSPLPVTPNQARPSARLTLQVYQQAYMQISDTDHFVHSTLTLPTNSLAITPLNSAGLQAVKTT